MVKMRFSLNHWVLNGPKLGFSMLLKLLSRSQFKIYKLGICNHLFFIWQKFANASVIKFIFGMASIFIGWLLKKYGIMINKANKVGWFLFISFINSLFCITRRFILVFFLVAIYGIISWYKVPNLRWFLLAIFGFVAASFFGAMSIGALVFIFFISLKFC